jgi:hypothetical protein
MNSKGTTMRKTMKKMSVAVLALVLIPATALGSLRVGSPFPGTVTATTYYSSGTFHGAVDISSGQCYYWGVETGVVATLFWNVTINTTGVVCNGSGHGNQNEAKHTFADDRIFRQWHFIKTASSYDRTCDRCQIGDEGGTGYVTGPHTHMQYDRYGSNITSWYSSYTSKGEFLSRGETVGYIQ